MVVLNKLRSATLVEALVATVLIIIIFIVASLILNNLLLNSFSKNTHALDTRINELQYLCKYNQIKLPFDETFKEYDISVINASDSKNVFKVIHNESGKIVLNIEADVR